VDDVNGDDRGRAANREVWPMVAVWLGLGEYDSVGTPVRRDAVFMAVQSAVVVALGAAVAVVKPALFGGDIGSGWPFGYVLLALPLVAGVVRRPPRLAVALAAALPAGLFAGGLAWLALRTVVGGFWLYYLALAVACLVAGPVFGALARDNGAAAAPEPTGD
jgi:hypothetical protein